uniref:Testis-specific serine/threonine-protein kinase 1-like n=1 Tax=Cyprinodon variegatus TaxID=28743 RepID=A0A3Q2CPZ6_CYPVA
SRVSYQSNFFGHSILIHMSQLIYATVEIRIKNHLLYHSVTSQCSRRWMSVSSAGVYVVMELCPNGDLKDFIASKGTLEEAIQYLHGINIAHRDIKCDNLLLDTNYNLKLCDFSISKRLAYTNGKLVLSSDFCGTPNYQAPEILKHRPYNPKLNDVWSMGIVLYEMLFGSLPFKNRNREEFVRLQMKRRITFPTTSSVSTQAKELIHSILQPVPENRITGTMGEIDKAGPSGTKTTTKSSQKTQLDNKLQKASKSCSTAQPGPSAAK